MQYAIMESSAMRTAMVVLFVFGLGWSGECVNAQDASRRALAEELLNAMNMKGASESTFDVFKKMMPSQMKAMKQAMEKGKKPSAEVAATADAMHTRIDKANAKMMDEMIREMRWEKVKDDYITIYAETYTEEELRGLVAFYKSPVGRAFTKKQPELMRRSMELAQKRILQWMPKLHANIQAMTREAIEASVPWAKENKGKRSGPTPVVPVVVPAQEPKLRLTLSHDQQGLSFPDEKPVMPSESKTPVLSVAFSPDGRTLASGGNNVAIMLWDVATGENTATFFNYGSVHSLAFSPDGKTLAAGSAGQSFRLWDVASGTATELKGHTDSVRSVAYSRDGKTLASGSLDKTIKLWDVATGKNTATFVGHASGVDSVAFSPDGKTLASGSFDETVKLWNVATGKNTATLNGHASMVVSVAFSPDGKTLASGSFDKTIRLWDTTTGNNTATLEQDAGLLDSLAFSPDGKTLASGSGDKVSGVIWLWDMANPRRVTVLKGQTNEVHAVAFSPDGKILASGSYDGTVKLWDVNTAKEAGVTSQQKPR